MSTEQTQPTAMYLGLTPGQFGMIVSLTSLSRQLQELVEGEQTRNLMQKLISEQEGKTPADNLAWVRSQRNHLLNVLHGVLFSQNLIAQMEDALVAAMTAPNEAASAVLEETENSGE